MKEDEVDQDNLVRTCVVDYSLVKPVKEKDRLAYKGITKKEIRVPVQRLVLLVPNEEIKKIGDHTSEINQRGDHTSDIKKGDHTSVRSGGSDDIAGGVVDVNALMNASPRVISRDTQR